MLPSGDSHHPTDARVDPARVARVREQLEGVLDARSLQAGADVLRLHGTDESWHPPAPPDLVAWPRDVEQAVAIVRACAAHRVPLIPFGAGSSLEGQIAALRGGVCVDMSEMREILRLSTEDLDVTVQAGVTREQLDARLRPEGVFFPVDPGADATIGGMVATAASGTTTVRYGPMRDNVLSLRVVTADGAVMRTRSRARKSAAGYDLTHLFVGSEGTLGLIVEATLRLRPTPQRMAAAMCAFPSVEAAVDCVIAAIQLDLPLVRVELLDELFTEALNRYDELGLHVAPTLLIELDGDDDEAVERDAAAFEELAREHGCVRMERTADEAQRRRLWRARHRAWNAALALRPGAKGLATDACVPISQLAACIAQTQQDLRESGLTGPITGHVGDGNFHVALLVDPGDGDELARAQAFHDRLVRRAIAMDGTSSGEHGVGWGKAPYLALEHGREGVAAMRAVKRALDPHDIFNPAKLADAARA